MNKALPWTVVGIIMFALLMTLGMWGCPKYGVYSKKMKGQAALAEAESGRKVIVEEALANKEAAIHKHAEDSIRAEGTAIAVGIINKQLTTKYIQWLWVQGLHDGSSETIYIATEANLPILEASRKRKNFVEK
jgi:hypothetical protein